MQKKRKRRAKVVPIAKAIFEPIPPVVIVKEPDPLMPESKYVPVLGRWARFHLWIGLLPSRIRRAVLNEYHNKE